MVITLPQLILVVLPDSIVVALTWGENGPSILVYLHEECVIFGRIVMLYCRSKRRLFRVY